MYENPTGPWPILQASIDDWHIALAVMPTELFARIVTRLTTVQDRFAEIVEAQEQDHDEDTDFHMDTETTTRAPSKTRKSVEEELWVDTTPKVRDHRFYFVLSLPDFTP